MENALKQFFGYDDFLDNQREVIEKIMLGGDLCVVMPTGAGKSLCYQLPILMRPGYGLVVSPLIALMLDQVQALRRNNIPAAFINSSISFAEQLDVVRAAEEGELKILYVAPERLQTDFFRGFLQRCPPSVLVVDEAHCISEWGHDFRPSYRRIGETAAALQVPQVCAFTATATPQVCDDIRQQLCRPQMGLLVAGFRRPNLSFRVQVCDGAKDAKKQAVLKLLEGKQVPTIIYAATRQAVDELAALPGIVGYHAGLSMEERNRAQDYFMQDPAPVLAATNAFGMGIDRPDVRRVIHYQLPGSLEAYYQEAGRAGRDGEAAECILLFSYSDVYIQKFLIEMNNPPAEVIRALYRELRRRQGENTAAGPLRVSAAELAGRIPSAKSDGQISAALGILEKNGAIRRSPRRTGYGNLRFLADPESLRVLHQGEKTQRSRFLHRLSSRYGIVLRKSAEYTLEELSAIAGLSEEQVKRVLAALNGNELEWSTGYSGREIELTDPELTEAPLDDAELTRHLDYEMNRLEELLRYARSKKCRQVEMMNYFGEKSGSWRCGKCDNCAAAEENTAMLDMEQEHALTALRAAQYFSGRIGIGKLSQILAGSRNSAIMAGNWHKSPAFGALRRLRQTKVEQLLRALLDCGDLERVERGGYPCVRLTLQGQRKLQE